MIKVKEDRKNKTSFVSIDNATGRVRKGIREALFEIGRENVKHTKELIRKPPKTGRLYNVKGMRHRASAPGEAPANRTGALLKSIGFRVTSWIRLEFGDKIFYGLFLEEGTQKMEPRPHLIRTVDERRRDNFLILSRATDKEIIRS